MDTTTTTDRIEREIVLQVPRARAWRAISDPREFGAWFRVDLSGATFAEGQAARGAMTYPGHEGAPFEIVVERIEPERLFSFRWHPYDPDPAHDYTADPTTLVEFVLEDVAGGTRLTVTESGFDALPPARRAAAFRSNSEGWAIQVQNIAAYVAGAR